VVGGAKGIDNFLKEEERGKRVERKQVQVKFQEKNRLGLHFNRLTSPVSRAIYTAIYAAKLRTAVYQTLLRKEDFVNQMYSLNRAVQAQLAFLS
jgi:hypothetical protein